MQAKAPKTHKVETGLGGGGRPRYVCLSQRWTHAAYFIGAFPEIGPECTGNAAQLTPTQPTHLGAIWHHLCLTTH